MANSDAKVFSSKIEIGKHKAEMQELRKEREAEEAAEAARVKKSMESTLPDDWSEMMRGSIVMACAMVPVGPDGDEYNEDLCKERQRVSNGILRMKGPEYFPWEDKMPFASPEEITKLMNSPSYRAWRWEVENPRHMTEDEYYQSEEAERMARLEDERRQQQSDDYYRHAHPEYWAEYHSK